MIIQDTTIVKTRPFNYIIPPEKSLLPRRDRKCVVVASTIFRVPRRHVDMDERQRIAAYDSLIG